MVEVIRERVTDISTGTEIDNIVEFEDLAASHEFSTPPSRDCPRCSERPPALGPAATRWVPRPPRRHPSGRRSAGGVGFPALVVLGTSARPGIELLLKLTDSHDKLPGTALVITGEGSLDRRVT